MNKVDTRLKAMAHAGRRAMLRHSLAGERSASHLADISGLSRPAASQHLTMLLDAGLMTVRVDGRRRWYQADPDTLDQVRHDLDVFWTGRLDALRRAAES